MNLNASPAENQIPRLNLFSCGFKAWVEDQDYVTRVRNSGECVGPP